MSWDYRVVKRGGDYAIHEVYCDDTTNKPVHVTVHELAPFGFTRQELRKDLELMLGALSEPTLRYEDFDKNEDSSNNR